MWEELGHCHYSAKYMNYYCKKSCQLCHEKESLSFAKKNLFVIFCFKNMLILNIFKGKLVQWLAQ